MTTTTEQAFDTYTKRFSNIARWHGNVNGDPEPAAGIAYPDGQYQSELTISIKSVAKLYVNNLAPNLRDRVKNCTFNNLKQAISLASIEMTNLIDTAVT